MKKNEAMLEKLLNPHFPVLLPAHSSIRNKNVSREQNVTNLFKIYRMKYQLPTVLPVSPFKN